MPPSIKDVLSVVLNPGYTHLSTVDANEVPTVATVPQYSVVVPQIRDSFSTLFALLKQESASTPTDFKAIIFGTTANGVALLHALFTNLAASIRPDLKVFQLQSRLSQNLRTRTTEEFKQASSGLMFASDVIGRGMDFPNVGLVIQLGLPSNAEQYIHRVGRTARAGKDGRAVIVLSAAESYFINVNKKLPIHPYSVDLIPEIPNVQAEVENACYDIDEATKGKAYQAFLGFNKAYMKNLRANNAGLVAMANEYAEAMACPEPPMIDKKVVGKMGLKGVPGLRVGTIERDAPPPPRRKQQNAPDQNQYNGNQSNGNQSNGRQPVRKRRRGNGGDSRPVKR